MDDAQTQTLPTKPEDQTQIAHSMGFANYPDFLSTLNQHRKIVAQHFEQVFILPDDNAPPSPWLQLDESTLLDLEKLGYKNAQALYQSLNDYANSHRYQQLNERSKRRVNTLLPALIEVAAKEPNPDDTLQRIFRLLENISRREAYLALLAEHPQTLHRLASFYSASQWVSDYLTQHPILLDELLDTRLLYQPPQWDTLADELHALLKAHQGDTEAQMDILRHFQHTQIFRLVAQDIAGLMSIETLSDHLSDLADLCLSATMQAAWLDMKNRHQDTPNFAIIAYGKLGGKELGYTSDLDLVFLYEDPTPGVDEIYARYARRIMNWLTTSTAAGLLYDIDLRLRPNGSSGLLVSTVEAFEAYQTSQAWVWEHQALTRARFAAGDKRIGEAFEDIRIRVLSLCRDDTRLKTDILQMRARMQDTHPPLPDDVKHCHGGLVDIEFMVQYLVLTQSCNFSDFTKNSGNIALLATAATHGLIDTNLAREAQLAYRELRRLQHRSGLNGGQRPSMEEMQGIPLTAVTTLWRQVFNEVRKE
jgi:glutamate-ammonia-ligase adenylyltransferase